MQIATIFSGIGAPEFAAREVFGEVNTVFACEIDKFARLSYLANHEISEAKFYKDIKELNGKQYAGRVDILIGGSPCQDFSIAGNRAGESGERGSLIWEYYRVVSEVRPKIFIYENVKGFLSISKGESYKRFLQALKELGYHCQASVLNTKDYCIPQNRERLYITGFLDINHYQAFSYAPKMPLGLNLGDMLDQDVDEKYFLSRNSLKSFQSINPNFNGKFKPKNKSDISNTITTKAGNRKTDNFIKVMGKLNIKSNDSNKRIYSTDGISPTLTTMGGGNREPKIIQHPRGFNKGGEFSICSTISSNSFEQNNLLKGERIRKLTPRECLRLQGFADSFKIITSDTQTYRQAGNAMSVNVIKMILERIKLSEYKKLN
ncbi:MAG: DNA cytosine methyltransferase [Campylobacter sp.]